MLSSRWKLWSPMTMSGPGCNTCWSMKRPQTSKKADVVKPFFADGGGRCMTTMRKDDFHAFGIHSMCSNVRNTSVVLLCMFSPDLWIMSHIAPLYLNNIFLCDRRLQVSYSGRIVHLCNKLRSQAHVDQMMSMTPTVHM